MIQVVENKKLSGKSLEAIKFLRTNLMSILTEKKSMVFTSTLSGEGKTLISFNTALSLSKLGKKVVYVDFNLRSDSINKILPMEKKNDFGLKEYLKTKKDLDKLCVESNFENLFLVSSGINFDSDVEISSDDAKNIISFLEEKFDYVIIDTPALGEFSDAIVLGKESFGVCIVVELEKAPQEKFNDIKNMLVLNNCNIVGTVINKDF